MEFNFDNFSCDIEVFKKDNDYIFRLYDKVKEQKENKIQDLVIVDPGRIRFHMCKNKG